MLKFYYMFNEKENIELKFKKRKTFKWKNSMNSNWFWQKKHRYISLDFTCKWMKRVKSVTGANSPESEMSAGEQPFWVTSTSRLTIEMSVPYLTWFSRCTSDESAHSITRQPAAAECFRSLRIECGLVLEKQPSTPPNERTNDLCVCVSHSRLYARFIIIIISVSFSRALVIFLSVRSQSSIGEGDNSSLFEMF